jgi:hypothetical protein
MTLEELADLIRANNANTCGRIDSMRNETNAALRRDVAELKSDVAEVRRNLDLASTVAAMRRDIETLAAEVVELKRRAS